jgi:murein DD-endopeptidase MepM/ murein hydrolase activator NlpD
VSADKWFFAGCVLAAGYYLWAGMPPLLQLSAPRPALAGAAVAVAPSAAPAPARAAAPPPPPPAPAAPALGDGGPVGCPVAPVQGRVAMTQGYGVGSHTPAAIWGAVDLAIDGDGDGAADVGASWGAPIVATHAGTVTATPNSQPAGNHVWVDSPDGWRTGYSHLQDILVSSGQWVEAGAQLGTMGSTGAASGPHLDYQVWRGGANVDPTPLVEPCFY